MAPKGLGRSISAVGDDAGDGVAATGEGGVGRADGLVADGEMMGEGMASLGLGGVDDGETSTMRGGAGGIGAGAAGADDVVDSSASRRRVAHGVSSSLLGGSHIAVFFRSPGEGLPLSVSLVNVG